MWGLKIARVTLKEILGWPSTSMWGPGVAVLHEWGPPGESGELTDIPQAVVEILAAITMGKKRS